MKTGGIISVIEFVTVVEAMTLMASLDILRLSAEGVLTAAAPSSGGLWSSVLMVSEYVLLIMVATSLITLVRHKRQLVIWLFGSFMIIMAFSVIFVLTVYYIGLYSIILAASGAGYTWWIIHNRKHSLVIPAVISIGVGALWVTSEPFYFVLLFPVGLGLYDIYAVFRGPLKALVGKPTNPAVGTPIPSQQEAKLPHEYSFIDVAATRIGGRYLGFGDTVIYSMMSAFAFIHFGLLPAVMTMIALNVGLVFTLTLLNKRGGPLPALPISVALGFIVILAAWAGVL